MFMNRVDPIARCDARSMVTNGSVVPAACAASIAVDTRFQLFRRPDRG